MEPQSRLNPHPDNMPRPSIFALVIGINSYPSFTRLRGAVTDAKSMVDYLLKDLNVPKNHITQLYDEQATRDAIIAGFLRLMNNPKIHRNDTIIIFYAGHGSEIDAPAGWETGGAKIQALVPWDTETRDSSGQTVQVIPDRTIATLLNDIARQKGDNITVILDCCHASSGTRNTELTEPDLARSVDQEELSPLLPQIDSSIVDYVDEEARASIVPVGFGSRELRSHVLLAACGAKELAWEPHGRGEFTAKLLEVLRGNDITNVTYSRLIQSFPRLQTAREQNPQCEGHNANRILFSILEGASSAFIQTEVIDQRVILKAGAAQGVCSGDMFDIYTNPTLVPNPATSIATLEVDFVEPYQATFIDTNNVAHEVPRRAWAIQIHSTSKILVNCSTALERLLNQDPVWRENLNHRISLVERSKAQISMNLDGMRRNVWFETHNPIIAGNGMPRLPHTIPAQADRVLAVLHTAAMWNWHLGRENADHPIGSGVRMEFFRVEPRPGHYNPNGIVMTDMLGENLNLNDPIHISGDRYLYYGMNIINNSGRDLYPYLFYFDASTFTIEPKYLGPIAGAGTPDAPLPAGGTLALGHGPGGTIPFAYHVGGEQELDIGILKLFVTDAPVGFGSIEQRDSPFGKVRRKVTQGRGLPIREHWDTSSIVLVQRRPETRPE